MIYFFFNDDCKFLNFNFVIGRSVGVWVIPGWSRMGQTTLQTDGID